MDAAWMQQQHLPVVLTIKWHTSKRVRVKVWIVVTAIVHMPKSLVFVRPRREGKAPYTNSQDQVAIFTYVSTQRHTTLDA